MVVHQHQYLEDAESGQFDEMEDDSFSVSCSRYLAVLLN